MRTVANVMTSPPVVVEPATTVQATSAAMLDAGSHAAVVVDEGKVCGLVTAGDISRMLAEGYDAAETLVGVIANRDLEVVEPDEPLAEVHERMRAAGRRVVAVAGPRGEPLGLLEDPEAAP
jgi:CBS domain-containing protein